MFWIGEGWPLKKRSVPWTWVLKLPNPRTVWWPLLLSEEFKCWTWYHRGSASYIQVLHNTTTAPFQTNPFTIQIIPLKSDSNIIISSTLTSKKWSSPLNLRSSNRLFEHILCLLHALCVCVRACVRAYVRARRHPSWCNHPVSYSLRVRIVNVLNEQISCSCWSLVCLKICLRSLFSYTP